MVILLYFFKQISQCYFEIKIFSNFSVDIHLSFYLINFNGIYRNINVWVFC